MRKLILILGSFLLFLLSCKNESLNPDPAKIESVSNQSARLEFPLPPPTNDPTKIYTYPFINQYGITSSSFVNNKNQITEIMNFYVHDLEPLRINQRLNVRLLSGSDAYVLMIRNLLIPMIKGQSKLDTSEDFDVEIYYFKQQRAMTEIYPLRDPYPEDYLSKYAYKGKIHFDYCYIQNDKLFVSYKIKFNDGRTHNRTITNMIRLSNN